MAPVLRSQVGGKDNPAFRKLTPASLIHPHRETFEHALHRVLATDAAELTFAQIADGLPISAVARDSYSQPLWHRHPLHELHREVCVGAVSKAKEFRETLDLNILEFNSPLVHGFTGAAPGSRVFQALLVEMVARSLRQLGTKLHQLGVDAGSHANDGLASWIPLEEDVVWWCEHPDGQPPPTLFRHEWYCDYDQYPNGISDGVGFWAEARILGGVMLFDRRDPKQNPHADPSAIYIHADQADVTYRICKLTDVQRQALLDFLTSKDVKSEIPLPIVPNFDNRVRVDPEEPLSETGIYRDLWERRTFGPKDYDYRLRDVNDSLNWVTDEDWYDARKRAFRRKWAWQREMDEQESESD
ncbi:hypothetical protein QQS21_006939 [Conoideocrella luteorostrata]|uniref:Uncharacterized protein n=1 Tax=Conoideocrella luteorostrata TaxID=1105319 RepID=A0AAJ0CPD0_9HYPO|nr:hypothetical protein QQS21_006939 [Conoideocrella luteorostrata]